MHFPGARIHAHANAGQTVTLLLFAVTPKKTDLILAGIPDDYVEVGMDLDLNCTISRIKPAAAEMYWMIGERKENGSVDATLNGDEPTWKLSNTLQYM